MSEQMTQAEQKEAVFERAAGCCEYCLSQVKFSPDPFVVEHIVPRVSGGPSQLDNLAFSCQGCNNHKFTSTQARDPFTGQFAPLYHPRWHLWKDHFAWRDEFTRIVGLTPTGRATIERLQLNREGLVNLREALCLTHRHPPLNYPRNE